jgi:hypothetical protein
MANIEQFQIGGYVVEPNVRPLEILVGRATHPDPATRPSMHDVTRELQFWLQPSGAPERSVSLEDARARAFTLLQQQRDSGSARDRQKQHVLAKLESFDSALHSIGDDLHHATGSQVEYGPIASFTSGREMRELLNIQRTSYQRCTAAGAPSVYFVGTAKKAVSLLSGIVLTATSDDVVHAVAAHVIVYGDENQIIWKEVRTAPAGSSEERIGYECLLAKLREHVPEAAIFFAETVDRLANQR